MPGTIDVAILTALDEELRSVKDVLGRAAEPYPGELRVGNEYLYPYGLTVHSPAGTRERYTLAVGSNGRMAGAAMEGFAGEVFDALRPEVAVLLGFAGAMDLSIRPGAVGVADGVTSVENTAVDDSRGRRRGKAVLQDPVDMTFRARGFQVDEVLRNALRRIRNDAVLYETWRAAAAAAILGEVSSVPPGYDPAAEKPDLVVDPLVSGPFLVRSDAFRERLHKAAPKAALLEMEAYGFLGAAARRNLPAIVIKGVSDLADRNKKKLEKKSKGFYREYAARNTARALLAALALRPRAAVGTNQFVLGSSRPSAVRVHEALPADKRAGAVNFAALPLLRSQGPVLRVTLDVAATAANGTPRRPDSAALRLNGQHVPIDVTRFHLPDGGRGGNIELFLTFGPPRVQRIEFTVTGAFMSAPVTFAWSELENPFDGQPLGVRV